jgi:glycosyltransferase involved in cell wall biosynthesis
MAASQLSTTVDSAMRVLMVTPCFLPEVGGVERHVQEVASRLAASGCEITVLTTDRSRRLPPRETRDGFEILRVRAWPKQSDLHLAPALGRGIAQDRWDVVHVQSYHTFVAPHAMWTATRRGLPFVLTFHGGGHSSRTRHLLRRTQRAALRPLLARARRLVAVAEFEVDLYGHELGLPRDRFVVIPNGTDLPKPVTPPPADDGILIASVGRLERYKGHHRAIAALPYLLQHEPGARLWIAGSGPYERRLRRLAERCGVADRVDIRAVPGEDREKMAAALSRVSLVVLLSEFETHPIAALEARALGLPLVVADTSGLRALAARGEARAVPLKAPPGEVAAAMLGQLRDPIAASAPQVFTWDDCASELRTLYRTVAEEAECAS